MIIDNSEGWVKIARSIKNSKVFANPELLKVWLWCQLRCRHSEESLFLTVKTGKGETEVEIKQHQFLYGRLKASEELNLAPSKVRSLISKLSKLDLIKVKSYNHYSIVTVTQLIENQKEVNKTRQAMTRQQPTNDQPMTNQQPSKDTNKNDKNDNKEENDKNDFLKKENSENLENKNFSLNDEPTNDTFISAETKELVEEESVTGHVVPPSFGIYAIAHEMKPNSYPAEPDPQDLKECTQIAYILKRRIKAHYKSAGELNRKITNEDIVAGFRKFAESLPDYYFKNLFQLGYIRKNFNDLVARIKNKPNENFAPSNKETGHAKDDIEFQKLMENAKYL